MFLAEALESFAVDVDRDAAHVLTSELASNAARHGKEPIDVTIAVEEEGLRISVFDRGDGFDPEQLSSGPREEGGWGLQLVQSLSSGWGVNRRDDGTEVWVRL